MRQKSIFVSVYIIIFLVNPVESTEKFIKQLVNT